jgi:hypothetical protein
MTTTASVPATVPPFRLEPAYNDRDQVWQAILDHAPYPLMASASGYGEMMGSVSLTPWFRSAWARSRVTERDLHGLLHDDRFVEAARTLYDAEVARPQSLVINIMGPMDAGAPHVDVATYRGLTELPIWLPMVMGMSGLFQRWAVRVAGVLTWFYDGTDGAYEYWPHGRSQPSEAENGPFGNVAVVGDNDLMFHQVGPIGDFVAFKDTVTLTSACQIQPVDDGWEIVDGTEVLGVLPKDQVRVSLLWRATTFATEADARVFDEHTDDLDIDTVVSTFLDDLADRGIDAQEPSDPCKDEVWSSTLVNTYLLPNYR